jgi:hypothetical protein
MDPVTLIETALATGAAAGLSGTASSAVKDAYEGLKAKVKQRFAGRPKAELILSSHEADPETWERPLTSELNAVGVDAELITAAQVLMQLIDVRGSQAGKYVVDSQASQGVQVGDNNTQINNFGPSSNRRIGVRSDSSSVWIGRNRMANQDTAIDAVNSEIAIDDSEIV